MQGLRILKASLKSRSPLSDALLKGNDQNFWILFASNRRHSIFMPSFWRHSKSLLTRHCQWQHRTSFWRNHWLHRILCFHSCQWSTTAKLARESSKKLHRFCRKVYSGKTWFGFRRLLNMIIGTGVVLAPYHLMVRWTIFGGRFIKSCRWLKRL